MTNVPTQAITDQFQLLFGAGTCAGLTDGQLLERFLAGRDEAGEVAFEALVARHGPMVMRLCRNVLDDPHDVHDAFQAVFLVLARRATAIRDRRSVGNWLYGVAVRVTARARVVAIRRQIRDRRTIGAARVVASAVRHGSNSPSFVANDRAEVVHQELSHLPEKYRAPVVLCYLEGLTHDEAAARLSWPVGTVRSRLSRARDRLRTRLSRRGLTAPASIGPMARWLTTEPGTTASLMATVSAKWSAPGERELVSSIVRAVSSQSMGRTTIATSVSSSSVSLAQGVLQSMFLKKLIIVACAFLPIGMVTLGAGLFLARRTQAQGQKEASFTSPPPARQVPARETPKPDDIDRLAHELLEAARRRYEAQKAYYEEGRITIDRFIDASKALELAELRLATTEADSGAVRRRHVDRIIELEKREKAELANGRGTVADVSEAHHRYVEAELDLKISQRQASETATLIRRLDELERKVERLEKAHPER